MKYTSINPTNGKVLKKYPTLKDRELEEVLQGAEFAFDINRTSTPIIRANRLLELQEEIEKHKEELAHLITVETGKPVRESLAEIEKCKLVCSFYAENAATFLADKQIVTDFRESTVQLSPEGIILGLMPWNYPFWQVFRFAVPTITAGNSVIVKHSPNVPQCALAIEKLFKDAHFPEGVYQNIFATNEQISTLISDRRIQGVALTGSVKAGENIGEQAGKQIKKCVLELGGNDAFIVLADANLKEAASIAVKSRMQNTGQSCIAAKRWIVEKSVMEPFLAIVKEQIQELQMGDPRKMETDIGPIARKDLMDNLVDQIQRAKTAGAKVWMGGEKVKGNGFYFQPTLLTDVKPGNPAFEEEFFGPVAVLIEAQNVHNAIELANDSEFGLGASLWTTDLAKAKRLARQIETGQVFINEMVQSNVHLPFGGTKKSGIGRELGSFGITEFVNVKTVVVG